MIYRFIYLNQCIICIVTNNLNVYRQMLCCQFQDSS